MTLFNNIADWLDNKSTPLSAYGLICLMVLAAFFGLDKLANANESSLETLESSRQELALLSAIDGQDIWAARKDESANIKATLDAALWQGGTAGAIAAQLQQNLRGKAQGLSMKNIRVMVDSEPVEIGNMSVLNFELSGLLPPSKSLHDSLSILAGEDYTLNVNQASLTFSTRRPSLLRLSGTAPIRRPAADRAPDRAAGRPSGSGT